MSCAIYCTSEKELKVRRQLQIDNKNNITNSYFVDITKSSL